MPVHARGNIPREGLLTHAPQCLFYFDPEGLVEVRVRVGIHGKHRALAGSDECPDQKRVDGGLAVRLFRRVQW